MVGCLSERALRVRSGSVGRRGRDEQLGCAVLSASVAFTACFRSQCDESLHYVVVILASVPIIEWEGILCLCFLVSQFRCGSRSMRLRFKARSVQPCSCVVVDI